MPPGPDKYILNLVDRINRPRDSLDRNEALTKLLDIPRNPRCNDIDKMDSTDELPPLFARLDSDQQEAVIDCVYDLCEDTSEKVRIHGYRTIVRLSQRAPNWTRRNTDVLVQLLQSDSSQELRVIKGALLDHIIIDPVSAFGIMCDHCAGDEESGAGVIQRLVLDFLLDDASHVRRDRLTKGSEAERTFNEGMAMAIHHATRPELAKIVDLISSLPSFMDNAPRPNRFRSPTIRALLGAARPDPGAHTPYNPTADAQYCIDKAMSLNGDPRFYLRFYANAPWGSKPDYAAMERHEFSRFPQIDRWLHEATRLWSSDDGKSDQELAEADLGSKLMGIYIELLKSALDGFIRTAPSHRDAPWVVIDYILNLITILTERKVAHAPGLRSTAQSTEYERMVQFARDTKDQNSTGFGTESLARLGAIVTKVLRLGNLLGIGTAMSKPLTSAAPSHKPIELNRKRPSEGFSRGPDKPYQQQQNSLTIAGLSLASPKPIRAMPNQRRSPIIPTNVPISPAPSLLSRLSGMRMDSNTDVTMRAADAGDDGADAEGGPRKRPKQAPKPPSPRSKNLLSRLAPGPGASVKTGVASLPKRHSPPAARTQSRMGISIAGAGASNKSAPPPTQRPGTLESRLGPTQSKPLTARIGAQVPVTPIEVVGGTRMVGLAIKGMGADQLLRRMTPSTLPDDPVPAVGAGQGKSVRLQRRKKI